MMERAKLYRGFLRGWKTYCAWGDIPYASGWFLDSEEMGHPFLEQVLKVSQAYPEVPPVVATHKGFALPGFDQAAAAPRDLGHAAKQYPGVVFLGYHSGHDIGEPRQQAYAGDANVSSSNRTVDSFIKALRENGLDAPRHVEPGKTFGNCPNVYAELGSVWRDYMSDADACAHLLGKLITYVGPKKVAWGTDSIWYGSPQKEIVALRKFQFTQKAKDFYNLPYGLEGDVEDPTQPAPTPARTIRNGILGRNAAEAYRVDPDLQRNKLSCDAVQGVRDTYVTDPLTQKESAPLRTNAMTGPRTRRELFTMLRDKPWAP
ncbi:MAG: amidohydrolase, partial [Acidimicrobiales bacterium]|nr:amidohydrolase [Acidimicrobiales bacterium]